MPFPHGTLTTLEAANHLVALYHIALPNPGAIAQFAKISFATQEAVYDAHAALNGTCNGSFPWMLGLLRYLEKGSIPQKVLALSRFNDTFGLTLNELKDPPGMADWSGFALACSGFPVLDRPFLRAYYASRSASTALANIEAIFRKAYQQFLTATSLTVIKALMENHGDSSGISTDSIIPLIHMFQAHPPAGGFAGFNQWGPGDHGNPVANLDGHVLKHVCRQPVDVDFGISETMSWWATLNVTLTLADYRLHAANPLPGVQAIFDGVNPLAGDHLKRFLVAQAFNNEPALTQFVKNQAIIPYRDYAIQQSAHMTDVIVHSSGTRVFISGRNGNTFIIGRFDAAQLGISSCYRPLDMAAKLAGARATLCWPLV